MATNQQQQAINSSNLLSPASCAPSGATSSGQQQQQRRKSTLSAHNFFIDYSRRRSSAAVKERTGSSPVREGAVLVPRNRLLSCTPTSSGCHQRPHQQQLELSSAAALQLMAPVALAGSRKTSIFDPAGHSLLQRNGSQQLAGTSSFQSERDSLLARRKQTLVGGSDATMLAVARSHAAKQRAGGGRGLGSKVAGARSQRSGSSAAIQHVPVIGCSPTSIGASLAILDESQRYEKMLRSLRSHLERKEQRRRLREEQKQQVRHSADLQVQPRNSRPQVSQKSLERRRKSLQRTIRAALAGRGRGREHSKAEGGSFSSGESEEEISWDKHDDDDCSETFLRDDLSVSSMSLDSPVSRSSLASLDRFLGGSQQDEELEGVRAADSSSLTGHSSSLQKSRSPSRGKSSLVGALKRLTGNRESKSAERQSRKAGGSGAPADYWYYYYYLRENSLDLSQGNAGISTVDDQCQAGGSGSSSSGAARESERRARLHINYSLARLQILNDPSSAPRQKVSALQEQPLSSEELFSQSTDCSLALSTSSSYVSSSSGPSTHSSYSSELEYEDNDNDAESCQERREISGSGEADYGRTTQQKRAQNYACSSMDSDAANPTNRSSGESSSLQNGRPYSLPQSSRLQPDGHTSFAYQPRRARSTSGDLDTPSGLCETQLCRSHHNLPSEVSQSGHLRGSLSQRSVAYADQNHVQPTSRSRPANSREAQQLRKNQDGQEQEQELDDFERLYRAHRGYVPLGGKQSEPFHPSAPNGRNSSLRLSVRSSRSSNAGSVRRRRGAARSGEPQRGKARASRSYAYPADGQQHQRAISMSWDTLNALPLATERSASSQQLGAHLSGASQVKRTSQSCVPAEQTIRLLGQQDLKRSHARSMAKLSSQVELASSNPVRAAKGASAGVRRCTSASLRISRKAQSNNNNNTHFNYTPNHREPQLARQLVNLNSDPALLTCPKQRRQQQQQQQQQSPIHEKAKQPAPVAGSSVWPPNELPGASSLLVASTGGLAELATSASGCSSGLDVQLRARAHSAGAARAASELAMRESLALARQHHGNLLANEPRKLQPPCAQTSSIVSSSSTFVNNNNGGASGSGDSCSAASKRGVGYTRTISQYPEKLALLKGQEQLLLAERKKSILQKNSFTCLLLGARQSGKRSIVKCFVKLLNEFKLATAEYRREKLLAKLAVCSEQLQQILEQRQCQDTPTSGRQRSRSRVNSWLASGPVHRLFANVGADSRRSRQQEQQQQQQRQRLSCSVYLNLPVGCTSDQQHQYQRRHTSVGESAQRRDQRQEDYRYLRVHSLLPEPSHSAALGSLLDAANSQNKSDSNINYLSPGASYSQQQQQQQQDFNSNSNNNNPLQLQVPELNPSVSARPPLNSTSSSSSRSSRSSLCIPQQAQAPSPVPTSSRRRSRRKPKHLRELITLKELHKRRLSVKFSTRRQLSERLLDQLLLAPPASQLDMGLADPPLPDAFLLVYAVNDRTSFEYAKSMLSQLRSINKHHNEPTLIVLVANKIDLERAKVVGAEEGRAVARKNRCKFIEVSCTVGFNLDNLLVGIRTQLVLRHHSILNAIFLNKGNENSIGREQTVNERKREGVSNNILIRFYKRYVTDNLEQHYDCDNFSKL